MKKIVALMALILAVSCRAALAGQDGSIDLVAADGRIVVYGEFNSAYHIGQTMAVGRDDTIYGRAIIRDILPTYMTLEVVKLQEGLEPRENDFVISAPNETGAILGEVSVRFENGGFLSYGDYTLLQPGDKVQVLRNGSPVAIAKLTSSTPNYAKFAAERDAAAIAEGDKFSAYIEPTPDPANAAPTVSKLTPENTKEETTVSVNTNKKSSKSKKDTIHVEKPAAAQSAPKEAAAPIDTTGMPIEQILILRSKAGGTRL